MELTEQARRDMELAAEVRAAAKVFNEILKRAAKAGLIVAIEVDEQEHRDDAPPARFITVEVERE
jgi:hypothetical protein